MPHKIVGLHGPIGSGKSTLARILANTLTHHGLKVVQYSFATPIKTLMNALFGWDDRHSFGDLKEVIDPEWGVSPRQVYRLFGTDFGRRMIRDDIWLRQAYAKSRGCDVLIIDDLRFPNEAEWVRANGLFVHVSRIGHEVAESGHESDLQLYPGPEDRMVMASDLDGLKLEAFRLAHIIKNGEINAVAT